MAINAAMGRAMPAQEESGTAVAVAAGRTGLAGTAGCDPSRDPLCFTD